MLIELFGKNFGSFRDEFRLSLMATNIDPDDPRGVVEIPLQGEEEPLRLLRCAAIYGPNASGKSTVLRAAQTLGYLIYASASMPSDDPIMWYEPFMLDDSISQEPVKLGVSAVVEGEVIEYSIEYFANRFVSEKLVRSRGDQEEVLIDRRNQKVFGKWKEDKQFELIAGAFRDNALLLSLADTLAPSLGGRIAVSLRQLLLFHDNSWHNPIQWNESAVAERVANDEKGFGEWLSRWVRGADVGIVDVSSHQLHDQSMELGKGTGYQNRKQLYYLIFAHYGTQGPVPLFPFRESIGTRKLVTLAPVLHDLASKGPFRAFFVDEIGASLHSELLSEAVKSFNCNLSGDRVYGQLVFATHETALIDDEARDAVLRRDQIYFVEKDSKGASNLYSLAEFKVRQNANIRNRYLRGRYGALPTPESLRL